MNFLESEAYLVSLGNEVSAMKLGLENIRTLLAALGEPQNKYLKVQVAGTNGKGSVCAFLDSICNTAGIKTGTFTSPHLVSITERIRINGEDISEEDFARHAILVRVTAENLLANGELEYRPTFFEQITAIALVAFAEAKIEVAILETGLGGRLDATTAANAEIAAITRIDLDHQEYLGETLAEIAAEKAAIIDGFGVIDVVIGKQEPRSLGVILEKCAANSIEPVTGDDSLDWTLRKGATSGFAKLDTSLISFDEFQLGLKGAHQFENAKTAVSISQVLHYGYIHLPGEAVLEGLQSARHPGRLEYVGKYLFDGAHNIGGANALAEYLREFETRPITLVFGAMRDKNVAEILSVLIPLADRIVLTEPSNSRSLAYEELLVQMPSNISKEKTFATNNVANAINIANEITQDEGIILVTGSLYLVGDVKKILNN